MRAERLSPRLAHCMPSITQGKDCFVRNGRRMLALGMPDVMLHQASDLIVEKGSRRSRFEEPEIISPPPHQKTATATLAAAA